MLLGTMPPSLPIRAATSASAVAPLKLASLRGQLEQRHTEEVVFLPQSVSMRDFAIRGGRWTSKKYEDHFIPYASFVLRLQWEIPPAAKSVKITPPCCAARKHCSVVPKRLLGAT